MHALSYASALTKSSQAELTAIWDDVSTRGHEMAAAYQANYYQDLEEMLATDLDAVIICSENIHHKEHVIKAAAYQKHILCEKPLATEVKDAEVMIAACEAQNVRLQVAYPVRFTSAIQQVKELIDAAELGNVLAINATNHGLLPGGWFIQPELSGGGCATDHIVHIVDALRWIFNQEVVKVYAAFDTRFYDIEVEDCGQVMIEFDSGMVVTIDPSWSRPKTFPTWGDVTMSIYGEEGMLEVDAFKQHHLFYNDQKNKLEEQVWADDMDEALVEDFLQCVANNREPFITGTDGLRTLEVVKAAYRSNQERKPITIETIRGGHSQ